MHEIHILYLFFTLILKYESLLINKNKGNFYQKTPLFKRFSHTSPDFAPGKDGADRIVSRAIRLLASDLA